MANKAAKALAVRNTAKLNQTLIATLIIHAIFLLLRIIIFRKSFTRGSFLRYVLLSAPALIIQFWFERIGRPIHEAGSGELKKSGEDLEAKGLTEFMWDILYWTYGCIFFAAVLGDWAWYAWVVIPLYSVWLGYTTFVGARQGMAGLTGAGSEGSNSASTGSKRQQKLEKRGGQRVSYR